MRRKILTASLAIIIVAVLAVIYGKLSWQADSKNMRAGLEAGRETIILKIYDSSQLEGLPYPVQKYLRKVLKDGQPLISKVSVEHNGTFNMSENGENWKPFTSDQRIITQRPGFDWNAQIQMAPGMAVYVHDAYIAGEGLLKAKILGLITVVDMPGTPELAQGELMRFFAEMIWYPTALLPGQGVVWEAVDSLQAAAKLTDGPTIVKLIFRFDQNGFVNSVYSDSRFREVQGKPMAAPWQCRIWDYQMRDGILVPLEGEAAWILPDGPKPYWRGRIEKIKYWFTE